MEAPRLAFRALSHVRCQDPSNPLKGCLSLDTPEMLSDATERYSQISLPTISFLVYNQIVQTMVKFNRRATRTDLKIFKSSKFEIPN